MGRKPLKAYVEKKFAIPLSACAYSAASQDRGIRDLAVRGAQVLDRGANTVDRKLVRRRVVYDTALAHLLPARFKLRLDQNYRLEDDSVQGMPRGYSHGPDHRRQHQCGGDKRYIHGYKADPRAQVAGFEVAGIGTLAQGHPRIPAQS